MTSGWASSVPELSEQRDLNGFEEVMETMMVYLTDDYGGGYLAANVKGKVVKTVPADP